jgi:hypothetical protein
VDRNACHLTIVCCANTKTKRVPVARTITTTGKFGRTIEMPSGTNVVSSLLCMSLVGSGSSAKNADHHTMVTNRGAAAAVRRMRLTPPSYGARDKVRTLLRADAGMSKGLARWANDCKVPGKPWSALTANHVLG